MQQRTEAEAFFSAGLMINLAIKKEALTALKATQTRHEAIAQAVGNASQDLFNMRRDTSEELIPDVEAYVTGLANSPKEFQKTFASYKAEFKAFNEVVLLIEAEARKVDKQSAAGAATGVAAGVGVAAFAPTAAMAIATTFGTASTGTAISSLTGIAATKAALAWLGGGALATGGGGMAAGQALLALSGPIGWTIGGTALLTAGIFARSRNRTIAQNAIAETEAINTQIVALASAEAKITNLLDLTSKHAEGLARLLAQLREQAPANYLAFNTVQKEGLATLINNVHSLSKLLNQKVEE